MSDDFLWYECGLEPPSFQQLPSFRASGDKGITYQRSSYLELTIWDFDYGSPGQRYWKDQLMSTLPKEPKVNRFDKYVEHSKATRDGQAKSGAIEQDNQESKSR